MPLPSDLKDALEALAQAKAYEARERERRIGLVYMIVGASIGLTFTTYGVLTLVGEHVPWYVWATAWAPFMIAGHLVARRLFRHLPTVAEDVMFLPPALQVAFGLAWITTGVVLGGMIDATRTIVWPVQIVIFGLFYLAQSRYNRDRVHALFGAGVLVFGAVLLVVRPPLADAIFLAAVAVGLSLFGLGVARYATPPRGALP